MVLGTPKYYRGSLGGEKRRDFVASTPACSCSNSSEVHAWEHCYLADAKPGPAPYPDAGQSDARSVCLSYCHCSWRLHRNPEASVSCTLRSRWQDPFMKKSHRVIGELHLLQVFAHL